MSVGRWSDDEVNDDVGGGASREMRARLAEGDVHVVALTCVVAVWCRPRGGNQRVALAPKSPHAKITSTFIDPDFSP